MRRVAALAVCLAVAGLAAADAPAQFTAVLFGFSPGSSVVSQHYVPARVTGQLTVSFHGDRATGCASRGLCNYTGSIVLRPDGQSEFVIATVRAGGRLSDQVALVLGNVVRSEVSRGGSGSADSGHCADQESPAGPLSLPVQSGSVTIAPLRAGGVLMSTRCAGPFDDDVTAAGPHASIDLGALREGRGTIDLGGSASFAAGGLAGSVTSSLRMVLGKPIRTGGRLHPKKFRRIRLVTEQLRLTGLDVGLSAGIRGTANPDVCGLLDSCGVTGTLSTSSGPAAGSAELVAIGSARLGRSRFLAALRGRHVRGISVQGDVQWDPTGSLTSSSSGPGRSCNDTAPLPGGLVTLISTRAGFSVSERAAGAVRTRCPGPLLGGGPVLAGGAIPRSTLSRRGFALDLRGIGPLSDDGYDVTVGGAVRIQLARGAVTQRVLRIPAG